MKRTQSICDSEDERPVAETGFLLMLALQLGYPAMKKIDEIVLSYKKGAISTSTRM